ncbi:hypothetical protein [Shewanella sp. T24-MNA-CIBAN-0130]|uniref:hypothetical protein n=1 Tax=Shewanella sp. T24-MNA-CIBAN-0130 TaxID=3140470 RepID=UPI00332D45CA
MKKQLLTIAILSSMISASAIAEEIKNDIDMSDPTDVSTSVGASYGNDGFNIKGQLMLSKKTATSGQKSGIIFEAKNVFDEDNDTPKFSGMVSHPTYGSVPTFNDTKIERSFRLRYGTINTNNGIGWSADAVFGDHPFYGNYAVIQAGPVMTIPVTEDLYIWPILYAGAVVVEDNMSQLLPPEEAAATNMSSSGIDIASTVMTGMIYTRYTLSEHFWVLLSTCYTEELQGKSWHDDVSDGGLQMPSFQGEIAVAYQMNQRQNIRFNYKTDNSDDTDDSYWVEYNQAF